MATAGPCAFFHQGDQVIALLQILQGLVVDLGLGVVVAIGPGQLPAFDAKLCELRGEVVVIGPRLQGLIPMGDRPGAGVLRGVGLAGQRFDQHGGSGGTAPGVPDGAALPRHPIGLFGPPGVGLEIGNRPFIHASAPAVGQAPPASPPLPRRPHCRKRSLWSAPGLSWFQC